MSAEQEIRRLDRGSRVGTRRRTRARFEIGRVLGTGISIWFAGLPAFVALTAVVFAPFALLTWWLEVADPARTERWVYAGGKLVLEQLLSLVVSATVIYAVFQRLRRRRVGIGASIAYGLGRLPAVVGVSVLLGLVFVALFVPMLIAASAGSEAGAALLSVPTLVLLAIAQCGLWVAVPVCVVERPGLAASLRRSWALTKGSKGAIFLLLLLFGLLGFVLGLMVTLLAFAVAGKESAWVEFGLSIALNVLVTSMTAVVTAVGYHELRLAVDGADPDELAAIFD